MNTERARDQLAYEEAARWQMVMDGNPSAAEREAFDSWLLESQRHIRSYLRIVALGCELRRMDPGRQLAVEPASVDGTDGNVVELKRKLPEATGTRSPIAERRSFRWRAAASLAALAVVLGAFIPWGSADTVTTAVGEQRIIKLPDGSVIYLNTQSRARVEYSGGERRIDLLAGEASFVVARDAERPFLVTAGDTVVQALGTEFNVYRRENDTAVSVVEGRVQVLTHEQPLRLDAGEQAAVREDGRVTKLQTPSVASAVSWRERRLVFRNDTLEKIATEFNRYNESPQLRIEGAEASGRRYSGIFDAYDPGSVAQLLSTDEALQVERADREIVVRQRR